MENRVKTRLSRIFQGSLKSCKTRHLLDVAENAVLIPQNHQNDNHSPPPHSTFSTTKVVGTKPSPLPSMCKPRHYCHEKTKPINDVVTNSIVSRRKLYSFLAEEGFKCPPGSPLSPSNIFISSSYKKSSKKKEKKKKAITTTQERKRSSQEANQLFRSYSQDSAYYYNWFSSEDEEEEEGKGQALAEEEEENDSVFFSSKSNTISSDSSGNNIAASKRHRPRKERRRRRRASTTASSSGSSSRSSARKGKDVDVLPLKGTDHDQGPDVLSSVKDSFAVVKRSSDPHNDFRTSMVEMIIEKQIFGAEELEHLLRCFLSLNSDHHHGIIVQVFDEICEALFSS